LSLEREVTFSKLNLKLLENSNVNLISQEGFRKKLSGCPGTDGKAQTGKVYNLYKRYGDINTQLIMNTISIHFGLIPDDIDPKQ
jgi:hypothetical protein